MKLKKLSTQNPSLHTLAHLHTFPVAQQEVIRLLRVPATSCNTTLWACYILLEKRIGWRLPRWCNNSVQAGRGALSWEIPWRSACWLDLRGRLWMRTPSTCILCVEVLCLTACSIRKQMHEYLETLLRHKSEMVNIEAARAICETKDVQPSDLYKTIAGKSATPLHYRILWRIPLIVLQLFLSSPKPVIKFAAVKTLSKLAQTLPQSVAALNVEMENLITDSNRSIATYAITTLLKVGLCLEIWWCWASVDHGTDWQRSFCWQVDEANFIVHDRYYRRI